MNTKNNKNNTNKNMNKNNEIIKINIKIPDIQK